MFWKLFNIYSVSEDRKGGEKRRKKRGQHVLLEKELPNSMLYCQSKMKPGCCCCTPGLII